jgi:hypothetical protein
LFHEIGVPRFLLSWQDRQVADDLYAPRLERAIGVIYLPESERLSHYFYATLPRQFDAIVHIDRTQAVIPLDRPSGWLMSEGDAPETFPSGI